MRAAIFIMFSRVDVSHAYILVSYYYPYAFVCLCHTAGKQSHANCTSRVCFYDCSHSCCFHSNPQPSINPQAKWSDLHRVLCGHLIGLQRNGPHREWAKEKIQALYETRASEFPCMDCMAWVAFPGWIARICSFRFFEASVVSLVWSYTQGRVFGCARSIVFWLIKTAPKDFTHL